jgi:hypothetical protein
VMAALRSRARGLTAARCSQVLQRGHAGGRGPLHARPRDGAWLQPAHGAAAGEAALFAAPLARGGSVFVTLHAVSVNLRCGSHRALHVWCGAGTIKSCQRALQRHNAACLTQLLASAKNPGIDRPPLVRPSPRCISFANPLDAVARDRAAEQQERIRRLVNLPLPTGS